MPLAPQGRWKVAVEHDSDGQEDRVEVGSYLDSVQTQNQDEVLVVGLYGSSFVDEVAHRNAAMQSANFLQLLHVVAKVVVLVEMLLGLLLKEIFTWSPWCPRLRCRRRAQCGQSWQYAGKSAATETLPGPPSLASLMAEMVPLPLM